jgi:drug/metabolite transporter (DMT)-like permease
LEIWFILAISVAFFWGISQVFAKYSTTRLGVARVALLIAVVEGTMYTIAFLVWHVDVHITFWDGVLAAGSCIMGITGYLCFFESIMDGQVAIAGTISAAYPVLTVIGAIVLISESLNAVQALGVVMIIGGVIALSYEPDPTAKHAITRRSLTFAFLAFAAWGIWSLTSKMAIDKVGAGNMFGFYIISSLTAPLMYAWFRKVKRPTNFVENPTRLAWIYGVIALAFNVGGAYAYTYALQEGTASLVVPTSSAYPIVTVVLAVAILKEKVHKTQIIWLTGVLIGLILIGVSV